MCDESWLDENETAYRAYRALKRDITIARALGQRCLYICNKNMQCNNRFNEFSKTIRVNQIFQPFYSLCVVLFLFRQSSDTNSYNPGALQVPGWLGFENK